MRNPCPRTFIVKLERCSQQVSFTKLLLNQRHWSWADEDQIKMMSTHYRLWFVCVWETGAEADVLSCCSWSSAWSVDVLRDAFLLSTAAQSGDFTQLWSFSSDLLSSTQCFIKNSCTWLSDFWTSGVPNKLLSECFVISDPRGCSTLLLWSVLARKTRIKKTKLPVGFHFSSEFIIKLAWITFD